MANRSSGKHCIVCCPAEQSEWQMCRDIILKNFSLFHIPVFGSQNRIRNSDMYIQNTGENLDNEHSFTPYAH